VCLALHARREETEIPDIVAVAVRHVIGECGQELGRRVRRLDGAFGARVLRHKSDFLTVDRPEPVLRDGRPAGVPARIAEELLLDPSPFLVTDFNEFAPRLSLDGHWLAYVSDQSGENSIYVRRFPEGDTLNSISTGVGTEPIWSRNGRELFYHSGNQLMVVDVETEPEFGVERPSRLFEGICDTDPTLVGSPNYDVSLDGQRFLMVSRRDAAETLALTFVQNWFDELQRLVSSP